MTASATMRTRISRAAAAMIAIVSFTAAVMTSQFLFVLVGMVALFFLATSFSAAARLSSHLQPLIGTDVEVRIWGAPLPDGSEDPLKLTGVRAVGAGLHLYFQTAAATRPAHLKVAQPGEAVFDADGLVVGLAAYVQWRGKRLPRSPGVPALTLRQSP